MNVKQVNRLDKRLSKMERQLEKRRNKASKNGDGKHWPVLKLTKLGLAGAEKTLEFDSLLAETLKLKFGGAEMTDGGVLKLCRVLPNAVVEDLDLSKNGLTDRGAKALARALKKSRIISLNVSKNPDITEEGMMALAEAMPWSVALKSVKFAGVGKLSKSAKRTLAKARRAPKQFKSEDELVDEIDDATSHPPPAPKDLGDVRALEKSATAVLSKLIASDGGAGGCVGGGLDSKAIAKLEGLTAYATIIPHLRSTAAADILTPLAVDGSNVSERDRIRAAMALANLIGDTKSGAATLRETGVVDLLLDQVRASLQSETFGGVEWDLGHAIVPLLSLSTQSENTSALKDSQTSRVLLDAAKALLKSDRPGDVERAVASLGHLQLADPTAIDPKTRTEIQVLLRDVRSRASKQSSDPASPYRNAGREAEALMDALQSSSAPAAKFASSTKYDVMISYSWDQKNVAKHLKLQLENRGFVVAFDEKFMSSNIYASMAEAVQGSAAVIVCASHAYRLSPNCQREASFAADLKKTIVPVIVQRGYRPDDWLGLLVAGTLYYDLTTINGTAFSKAVDRLTSGEKLKASKKPVPTNERVEDEAIEDE